jgi:peroxiredoxin
MPALLTLLLVASAPSESPAIPDVELTDPAGVTHRLGDWHSSRLVVVALLSADCPLARLYTPRLNELAGEYATRGVTFTAVFPNDHDAASAVARFGKAHGVGFPLLLDPGAKVSDRFGARRTPEVFVLDEKRVVRYRGRIDDQYDTATHRAQPTRRDLALALDELLDGRPV